MVREVSETSEEDDSFFVFNFSRAENVRLKILSAKVGIKNLSFSHYEKSSKVVSFSHLKKLGKPIT
ncbi:MAG: hypothetical protein ACD_44C00355G0003 [uncultured bacterium]|nr:MAG: hypothetical protein ACD_44C00355G0003 [uncultured bacterium]